MTSVDEQETPGQLASAASTEVIMPRMSIIGLFDILGMLRSVSRDVPWRGLHTEPLLFGSILFFIICFVMSKYSRHLEVKLSAGANR